jgi:malate dehydrogenase (quinone)
MSGSIPDSSDIILIGAGIMSATLGTVLKELDPSATVVMLETLADCAQESSQAWNNAGTGHAANCELNYTPQRPDGSVDISKALEVNTEFDLSRQLWSHLIRKGAIADPRDFIHSCPHMSFVWGNENVAFLWQRFKEMSAHHCYRGMEYSEDASQIGRWTPLIIEGRTGGEPCAATRIITGTDVDYGALTHLLVGQLTAQPGFSVHYLTRVTGISREADGKWRVEVENTDTFERQSVTARFVFIGAGGGALELLQKSGIPEGHGYGGFPVSGIWLRCDVDAVSIMQTSIERRRTARRPCPSRTSIHGRSPVGNRFSSAPIGFAIAKRPLDQTRKTILATKLRCCTLHKSRFGRTTRPRGTTRPD